MDSNYFGEPNMGGSGSSSRKGKKNNQDKPKQPQRGLGVAQLEKIRLHGEMAYSYHPSLHPPYPSNFNNVSKPLQFSHSSIAFLCFPLLFCIGLRYPLYFILIQFFGVQKKPLALLKLNKLARNFLFFIFF